MVATAIQPISNWVITKNSNASAEIRQDEVLLAQFTSL
jgi:hypothetical protein